MAKTNRYNLPDKQREFVLAYLTSGDLVAAKAYRKIYTNCTPASARASASRLLKLPAVKKYIQYIGMHVGGPPPWRWKDPYEEQH